MRCRFSFVADSDFAAPSSLPLPVGSDAEGWAAMQRGYRQHTQAERRRKANPAHASEPHHQADYRFSWDVFTLNVSLWKEILADDVLQNAVYRWRLLRPADLITHDDYMWRQRLPAELRPRQAIDAFVSANRNSVEVVHRSDQIVLRKLAGELPDFC